MVISISSGLTLYVFPPGRGIHALERVAEGARALGLPAIVTHSTTGIGHFRTLMDLQARYRIARTALYGPDTFELDNLLDRSLTAVDGYLDGQIRLFPEAHPRADAASTIRPALFPEGVAAITGQPFVQQRVEVDRLVETYQAPALVPARAELPDLDVMMVRVAEINREYGTSIDGYDRDRPTKDTLRAAQQQAQESLAETYVLILAAYIQAAPEQREAIAALLEPILRQNEAIGVTRRRRKQPVDIDPGTGIELPEEPEPPVTPA